VGEFEAGHGAVGVKFWVGRVFLEGVSVEGFGEGVIALLELAVPGGGMLAKES